ncbi:MAG: hypothetical protein ACI9YH_004489 [Colwellia sp.]|jgi:hypothetical protein
MNTEINIETLKKNPKIYRDTIQLVKRPDGLFCKHPSDFFNRNYLKHVGSMTNEEVADNLGITPKHLSNFLNEKDEFVDHKFIPKQLQKIFIGCKFDDKHLKEITQLAQAINPNV